MKRTWILRTLFVFLLLSCTAKPSPTPSSAPTATPSPAPTSTPTSAPPATEPSKPEGHPGLPLPTERGELFSASGACATCHTNMVDEAGNDVSTDAFWRGSMMANSSRDPYWRASVKGEVLSNPDYQAVIEDKCATCHMPMARFSAVAAGGKGKIFEDGFLHTENELHTLALDGISCTLCHQIQETGFGEPESHSGGFVIDADRPAGERLAFGPYQVGKELMQLMQSVSGFIPVQGLHMERSELCATCHTLYTPYVDAAGEIAGEFPEQMPYLEWLYSNYSDTQACQDCHMPEARGRVRLSTTGGPPRSPFFQHVFVGGNAYMLRIFGTFGEELEVTASSLHFADKGARATDQLQNRTATIALKEVSLAGLELTASVIVESQAGHKFPSGFPARRAWLRLTVSDAGGQIVFESGAVNRDGSIADNDNDLDPAAYEHHYQTIESPDQVQIYEAIMEDTEGNVTTTLLRGAGYAKDNRLLPSGFDKNSAQSDIAVYGLASEDEDFVGGGDRVQYKIDLGNAQGPFKLTAQLLYQSIGYRWADNLRRHDSPESSDFLRYYETVPNLPVVVASETTEVGN